jgi:hypothetical protein
VLVDYGWSNWTQEGTTFHCARKLHPEEGFDRFYGDDNRLGFAQECKGYEEGEGIRMDVDRETVQELNAEQKVVWELLDL